MVAKSFSKILTTDKAMCLWFQFERTNSRCSDLPNASIIIKCIVVIRNVHTSYDFTLRCNKMIYREIAKKKTPSDNEKILRGDIHFIVFTFINENRVAERV